MASPAFDAFTAAAADFSDRRKRRTFRDKEHNDLRRLIGLLQAVVTEQEARLTALESPPQVQQQSTAADDTEPDSIAPQ
ncbi:hypothetical protein [Actinoplanes sp. NPDC023714]|uniref:hypothetical protein n=1 Tax=Actinoplanes sp. NPDC023714 TaxID=3154322 RepID=UPI0033C7D7F7